jgi:hypothetical protein
MKCFAHRKKDLTRWILAYLPVHQISSEAKNEMVISITYSPHVAFSVAWYATNCREKEHPTTLNLGADLQSICGDIWGTPYWRVQGRSPRDYPKFISFLDLTQDIYTVLHENGDFSNLKSLPIPTHYDDASEVGKQSDLLAVSQRMHIGSLSPGNPLITLTCHASAYGRCVC